MINLIGRLLLQAVMKLFFDKTIRYIVVGDPKLLVENNLRDKNMDTKVKWTKEDQYNDKPHDYGHPN